MSATIYSLILVQFTRFPYNTLYILLLYRINTVYSYIPVLPFKRQKSSRSHSQWPAKVNLDNLPDQSTTRLIVVFTDIGDIIAYKHGLLYNINTIGKIILYDYTTSGSMLMIVVTFFACKTFLVYIHYQ